MGVFSRSSRRPCRTESPHGAQDGSMLRRLHACTAPASAGNEPRATLTVSGSSPLASYGTLAGVRPSDGAASPQPGSHENTRTRPRVVFTHLHAVMVILVLSCALCVSLTMLVRQSMNYQAMLSSAQTGGGSRTPSAGGAVDNRSSDGTAPDSPADGGTPAPPSSAQPPSTQLPSTESPPTPSAPGAATTSIDLNTASAQELDTIPGIGEVMAQRILDHRRAIGRFSSVDQLLDVPGIGVKTLEKIRPKVSVR